MLCWNLMTHNSMLLYVQITEGRLNFSLFHKNSRTHTIFIQWILWNDSIERMWIKGISLAKAAKEHKLNSLHWTKSVENVTATTATTIIEKKKNLNIYNRQLILKWPREIECVRPRLSNFSWIEIYCKRTNKSFVIEQQQQQQWYRTCTHDDAINDKHYYQLECIIHLVVTNTRKK